MAAVAWVIDDSWIPTVLEATPLLTNDYTWSFDGGRHLPSFSWEAFVVRRFDEASPGARQRTEAALAEWMDSGLLTSREDVRLGGLEDVPAAFVDVCCGRTRGTRALKFRRSSWIRKDREASWAGRTSGTRRIGCTRT